MCVSFFLNLLFTCWIKYCIPCVHWTDTLRQGHVQLVQIIDFLLWLTYCWLKHNLFHTLFNYRVLNDISNCNCTIYCIG